MPNGGETVVAFVVMDAGMSIDADAFNAFLATRLAKYKIPREYLACEALPRTPTGKLAKAALRPN